MKKFILASAALLVGTVANAGSLVYTAPEVAMIEEPARMGGSGAWLIPLIIIAVVALTLTNNDNDNDMEIQPNGLT